MFLFETYCDRLKPTVNLRNASSVFVTRDFLANVFGVSGIYFYDKLSCEAFICYKLSCEAFICYLYISLVPLIYVSLFIVESLKTEVKVLFILMVYVAD